jgi:hypothetical protein
VLSHSRLVGFVATAKPAEARSFYQGVLGLPLVVAWFRDPDGNTLSLTERREG